MQADTLQFLNKTTSDMTKVASLVREDTFAVLKTGDHVEVIRHFVQLRTAMDTVKQAREALEKMADDLSKVQIPEIARDLKERTGVKPPFKIEGIGSVSIANKLACSIKDDPEVGKEKGYDWLRAENAESLIKPTVNAATLAAFAKDRIENAGLDMPEDIFTVSIQHYTSVRK